jgi:cytochrome c5
MEMRVRFLAGSRWGGEPAAGLRAGACCGLLLAAVMSLSAHAAVTDRSGSEVVAQVCGSCHTRGDKGAPRIGDQKAWASRAAQGLTSLTAHALQGIRDMPAHGGNMALGDIEIERAIVYMVNRSGGHWVEPIMGATPAVMRTGEQVARQQCAQCHQDGRDGAPKIGDRVAWIPRLSAGLDAVVRSAVHGHGGMPSRGGMADLSDRELRSAVVYMFNYGLVLPRAAAAAAAPSTDPFHKTVAGTEVYLGVLPTRAMSAAQRGADVPTGQGYFHLNLSLFDARTRAAVADAQIEVQVADAMGSEKKALRPMKSNDVVSYGGYFRMDGLNPYTITAEIRRPGVPGVAQATFEYRPR